MRKTTSTKPTYALSLLALLALALAGCAVSRIGYGVILWSNNSGNLLDGQIVTVRSESTFNNSYQIQVKGVNGTIQIPIWRVKLFKSEQQAINYSLAYAPYAPMYAKATSNGAAIRESPDTASQRTYRMRQGQLIKIISKETSPATVEGTQGYWYQVLTNDGTLGYSFSSNLDVFNPAQRSAQTASASTKLLDTVMSTVYRPQYFQQMIDTNRIDLAKFSTAYGFFPDQAKKTIRIDMPTYSLSFNYTDVKDLGNNDYVFDGTPVQMTVNTPEQILLQYSDNKGNQYSEVFVKPTEDIGMVIEQELNRRLQVFGTFLDKQPFSSDYYGSISLTPGMQFTWTGFDRLVPDIIPPGTGSTGVVDFPLSLGDGLVGRYDGVVSFYFGADSSPVSQAIRAGSGAILAPSSGSGSSGLASSPAPATPLVPKGTRVSFLYTMSGSGMRLTYVPDSTVTDDVVTSVSSTPIIIYFSFKTQSG